MKVEIRIPTLGESVLEAVISRVIKPSGSAVLRDEEIVELETDKVNQVIYAPESGELQLTVQVGERVKIGQVIGSVNTAVKISTATTPLPDGVVREGSSARQLIPEAMGTVPPPPSAPPLVVSGRKKMSGLRRTMAQRLVEVKNTTAMLTTFNEVDMSHITDIRREEQEGFQKKYGVKLGLMSFFMKAAAGALQMFPQLHAFIEGDDIVQFPNYDMSVAVSTDRGLVVPVVRGCDTASLGELEQQLAALAKKGREGTLSLEELRGGCFTITNGGVFGSLLSTPILNPPQSGILGMHAIVKRPVVVGDAIVIRPMMYVALSYDHRLIDGRESVQFLVYLKEVLEDPSRLLSSGTTGQG